MRFTNLYDYFLSYIGYFLFFIYFLVMKFSIVLELIIVFFFLLLIVILIYSCVMLIKTVSLLAGIVPQYFFWLLPSEESNSFSISSEDIFSDCSINYPNEILHIFCIYSGFRNYPLYRIVTIFVYNLWFIFLIVLVSISN